MRKRFTHIFMVLSLVLLLAGCGVEPADPSAAPSAAPSTAPTETPRPIETVKPSVQPSPEPTATASPDNGLPYLQRIDRFDQSLYEGPGYDYVFVGVIRERGTYTIVEEVRDHEGNLWGKLKSGAGWVDLTEIRSEDYANALLSANYADENMLLHGSYHYYPDHKSEYCTPIAFRAYGKLKDVMLFDYEFSGEDYTPGEAFFTLPEMNEEMPLVAELAFPGDMSKYGIRFVDEIGVVHIYDIYISGRNGALILEKR